MGPWPFQTELAWMQSWVSRRTPGWALPQVTLPRAVAVYCLYRTLSRLRLSKDQRTRGRDDQNRRSRGVQPISCRRPATILRANRISAPWSDWLTRLLTADTGGAEPALCRVCPLCLFSESCVSRLFLIAGHSCLRELWHSYGTAGFSGRWTAGHNRHYDVLRTSASHSR